MAETRDATPEEAAKVRAAMRTGRAETRDATPEEAAKVRAAKAAAPSAPAAPSTGRAVAEGALQGGTYGFGDELQGVIGAVLRRAPGLAGYPSPEEQGEENIFPGGNSFVDDYRMERDAARRDRQGAEKAHPDAFGASQIAAALLTPGPKAGKTIGSFAKAGAKAGGAYGLGASDSDLTKGEVGGALLDTGIGTGLGGAAGAAGGAVNKYALQPLARKAASAGRAAFERGAAQAQKPIDKAIESASGSLGGRVTAGRSTLANLAEDAVNADLPEDVSRRAGELLSDDMAKALNERVARATQAQFFQRLPRIEKATAVLDETLERGTPEARDAAIKAFMDKSPMKRAMWEIAKRILPTTIGASIGGGLGGTAGAGVGGALGLMTGAMSGAPGRIVTNAVRSPQFQRSAAQLGERVAGEVLPGAIEGLVGEQAGAGKPHSAARDALAPYLDLLDEDRK